MKICHIKMNESSELEKRLDKITLLTNNCIFCGTLIRVTLLAYAQDEEYMQNYYDGLFWGNEGKGWEYECNKKIVKEIDNFFIAYRLKYYPYLEHKNYQIDCFDERPVRVYKTRYEYLKSK